MGDWGTDDGGGQAGKLVWMTANECVEVHGYDPMRASTGKVRSKLVRIHGRALVRVWLEADVLRMIYEAQDAQEK